MDKNTNPVDTEMAEVHKALARLEELAKKKGSKEAFGKNAPEEATSKEPPVSTGNREVEDDEFFQDESVTGSAEPATDVVKV